jgi:hypothetical protein
MTSIWYEIFPVTIVSKKAMLIRFEQEQQDSSWMIPHLPDIHPNENVIYHLQTFFGDNFDPRCTIVHSTSWRFEHDRLSLTYLAVLPQGNWIERFTATRSISLKPIGAIESKGGDHLYPPAQLRAQTVLAHALDHLASLSTYDQAIQSVLEPEWQEILKPRVPRSAGCLFEPACPVGV